MFATDWGTLTVPGMLVDDTSVTVGGQAPVETSFETDLGGWSVPGAHPEDHAVNLNDWIRSEVIFEDAAVTKTTRYRLRLQIEGVNTPEARTDLMERTLQHLLPSG